MSRPVECSLPNCHWVPFTSRFGMLYAEQGWRLRTADGHIYAEIVKNYATRTFGVPGVLFRKGKVKFVGLYPTWKAFDEEHGRHAHHLDAPRTRNAAMRYMEAVVHDRAWDRWRLLRGVSVVTMGMFWGPR